MDMLNVPASALKAGPVTKLFTTIAGCDWEILKLCGPNDLGVFRTQGLLMILNLLFEGSIYSYVAHRLYARPGEIRPELILASLLFALYVMVLDLQLIIRPSAVRNGRKALKTGGLAIEEGLGDFVKVGIAVGVRFMLAVGLSLVSGIFCCLLLYGTDIEAHIQNKHARDNAKLISGATAEVNSVIQQASRALDAQNARVGVLAAQVESLRQNEIANPDIFQAQQEVARLTAQKAKVDDEVRDAEIFATNEAGGIKGAAGNSGLPGYRSRYRAAAERVTNAKARAQQVANDLNAARVRLDMLRDRMPSDNGPDKQRVRDLRSELEQTLRKRQAVRH
jgi:hypothetical protein